MLAVRHAALLPRGAVVAPARPLNLRPACPAFQIGAAVARGCNAAGDLLVLDVTTFTVARIEVFTAAGAYLLQWKVRFLRG
jgi:hypothetical protein